jgi:mRNA interferase MazF
MTLPTESLPMKQGEICLGAFPFGDAPGLKIRPVLVLSPVTGPSAEVLVASISSVIPDQLLATDVMLDPLTDRDRETNLKTRSLLRLHKLATIHRTSLPRHLGQLSPDRLAHIRTLLRLWLGL